MLLMRLLVDEVSYCQKLFKPDKLYGNLNLQIIKKIQLIK